MALRIPVLFATAALALCSPAAAQDGQPFALEDVDFAPDCTPNAAFNRLLTLLFGLGSFPDNAAAFDEPLHNAVAGDTYHVLRFDRAADWHGLHLVEIRVHLGIERGPANYALVFADSADRVRDVWNTRGWNLPAPGQAREIDSEVYPVSIGVDADEAQATVTCFSD